MHKRRKTPLDRNGTDNLSMEVIEVKKGSEGSSIDDEGYDANPQNGKDVEKYLEAGNDDMTAPGDVRISRSSEW